MNTKNKIMGLLKEGFKLTTLKKLDEKQINVLYKKVIKEQNALEKSQAIANNVNAAKKGLEDMSELMEDGELSEDWGSSDQSIMNASIHRDMGEPDSMPSPFDSQLESAVESAVDFYWDDWEEYQSDRQGLIDHAKRLYLRRYFREQFENLVRMFEPVRDVEPYDVDIDLDGELGEDAALNKMAGIDPNEDPNPEGNEDGPSDNMKANDGMGIFEGKKKPLKMKTPIASLGMFEEDNEYAICMDSIQKKYGPKKTWKKNAEIKFDACVKQVGKNLKESKVREIEESLVSLLKNYKKPTMTKKDLIGLTEQGTKEAPVKTPTIAPSKPDRKTPYQPKHRPAPKADTKTAPTRVKPGTKEKPQRGTPYQPKHKPAPKADTEIPDFLKFNNLNITFRDE